MSSARPNLRSLASSLPSELELSTEGSDEALTLRGSLRVVSALDLVQWLCLARQSWNVRLYGQGVDGDVVVKNGDLVGARWGGLCGTPALLEIVSCNWGCFALEPVSPTQVSNLSGTWQSLLFSAVQELDERRRAREQRSRSQPLRSLRPPPSLTGRSGEHALADLLPTSLRESDPHDNEWPAAAPARHSCPVQGDDHATAESLIDQGFSALRSGDFAQARQHWLDALALEPDNRIIQHNLRRLHSMPPTGKNKASP